MKKFNSEEAVRGNPVMTISGKEARIVCFNAKIEHYPLLVLVENKGREVHRSYTENGRMNIKRGSNEDMCMVTVKKTGWINIYKHRTHHTEELARQQSDHNAVATIQVDWEE